MYDADEITHEQVRHRKPSPVRLDVHKETILNDSQSERLADSGAVVVAHARLDLAWRCVETLRRFLPREHVVVVLNAPNQLDDEGLFAALSDQVRVVSPPAPQGYGANLNLGIRSLPQGLRFVVLTNDDVEFGDDSLPKLIDHLCVDARVGAVGPTFRDAIGTTLPSVGAFPTALDAIVRSAALPPRARNFVRRVDGRLQMTRRLARGPSRPYADAEPADWIVGAAMAVRVDALHGVGGFDEDFFLYFEEADFCYRLWANGWIVLTARDASVVHLQGQSTAGTEYRAVFRQARRLYLIKRLGLVRWTMLELLFLFVLLTTSAVSLASALVKPGTASRRLQAMRECWNHRAFLLPPFRRPQSIARARL
jgi:N-acetylglucosaminyl-diphospho-decaprenol L-rhamnosyltransferase